MDLLPLSVPRRPDQGAVLVWVIYRVKQGDKRPAQSKHNTTPRPFPPNTRRQACAAAGKHVFCEKPIATGLAETIEAINTCREANVKLMTALQVRLLVLGCLTYRLSTPTNPPSPNQTPTPLPSIKPAPVRPQLRPREARHPGGRGGQHRAGEALLARPLPAALRVRQGRRRHLQGKDASKQRNVLAPPDPTDHGPIRIRISFTPRTWRCTTWTCRAS